ncbi:MAG: Crp/Fnr family transcriptional regulator [candidate division WOR-3 bacterium]|nr:Crp/Fnr family transcriptional regulator [candidate division WOR-3 bacterium]
MTDMGVEKVLQDNEVLFREGDAGDEMYLIKSGKVKIIKKVGDDVKVLAVLREGDFFGEMSIIDCSPRSATALSDGETHLITFDKSALKKKMGEEPLIEYIVTELTTRLRKADEQIKFLMIKSLEKRLIAFLITKAEEDGIKQDDGSILLNFNYSLEELSSILGIKEDKLEGMIDQLKSSNLIEIRNQNMFVRGVESMEDYLRYVSLKEKFGE